MVKADCDPNIHVESFLVICDLFRIEAASHDAICLRFFPFTLVGEAKAWLRSLEPSSITTWDQMRNQFVSRFFPPAKADKLKADIRTFQQGNEETFADAWERFKRMMYSCPSQDLSKSEQVQTFYPGGVFMYKTPVQGYQMLEDMLIHNIDWTPDKRANTRNLTESVSFGYDLNDEVATMKNNQVKLERKMDELIKSVDDLQVGCDVCKGPHLTKDCPNKPMITPEDVNFMNRGYQGGCYLSDENPYDLPERFTLRFVNLDLDDEEGLDWSKQDKAKEDHKQEDYADIILHPDIDKAKKLKKKKKKEGLSKCTYVLPIKEDPGNYNIPFSVSKFSGVNGISSEPIGIAENVPIRVRDFIFPTDFMVANLPKHTNVPIIFGRAFLHTTQSVIDMRTCTLSIEHGDKRMKFTPNGGPLRPIFESFFTNFNPKSESSKASTTGSTSKGQALKGTHRPNDLEAVERKGTKKGEKT
ncbi:hypothetical protein OSB04_010905 [Centaurea solstitialis]|uniref:Retrotransposon gag domain-containing protein n=1 Tax=Centaurea solstitialis TaxID=347529 RepID=A0AA38TLL6_9ASTR|nr:hypothetical protein OSB04_010905 [Centaurea solstitialis]